MIQRASWLQNRFAFVKSQIVTHCHKIQHSKVDQIDLPSTSHQQPLHKVMGRSIKVKEGKDQVLPSLKAITKSDLGDELVEHFGDMRRLMNTFMRLIDIRISSHIVSLISFGTSLKDGAFFLFNITNIYAGKCQTKWNSYQTIKKVKQNSIITQTFLLFVTITAHSLFRYTSFSKTSTGHCKC